jgi:hypothetical protein
MWVILEFFNFSPREWAAAFAFHAISQPTFLSPQVYLRGKPFLFTVIFPLLLRHRHCIFFLTPLYAPVLHSHKLSLAYASQAPLPAYPNGEALPQEAGR